MKKRFTEEQIIRILRERESGESLSAIARDCNISAETLYSWKSKYSGMEVSVARKLKQLEKENRKLKMVVADLTLDNKALKNIVSRN